MDPLSDVLQVLRPERYAAAGFDFGMSWALEIPRHRGIKCLALASGQGWLRMEGVAEPVWIAAGDCLLLPHGRPFRVASDLELPASGAEWLATTRVLTMDPLLQGAGHTCGFAAHFDLPGPQADFLLSNLPPILHIRKDAQRARLRWCLEQMMVELADAEPGSTTVLKQLAGMILVQALRVHIATASSDRTGWLFALADSKLSGAIRAMHEHPGQPWTLQSLASHVGMSRTAFALKFKATVGQSPMDYLTRWRMLLARESLTTTPAPISSIANALGYESESAFRSAFRRVTGQSPRQWARSYEALSAGV